MSCFKDILYQSIKSKNNLPVIIILSSFLAYIQISRSYYIGKITQNRSIKDVVKAISRANKKLLDKQVNCTTRLLEYELEILTCKTILKEIA